VTVRQEVIADNARVDSTLWWYVVRRRMLIGLIGRLNLDRRNEVLDVGSGTGVILRLLQDLGFENVTGLDVSRESARICQTQGLGPVRIGDVTALPFEDDRFDFIVAAEVLEHVDRDDLALAELTRVLSPGGRMLVTVPAFPSLWGWADEEGEHKRRYRLGPLKAMIAAAGLTPLLAYHYNFLLFGPIWLARRVLGLFQGGARTENQTGVWGVNAVLKAVFMLDVWLARLIHPPFGASILVVVQKGDRG
jgi:SAM-dependent methyltransferase